jgi:hypothetical protein
MSQSRGFTPSTIWEFQPMELPESFLKAAFFLALSGSKHQIICLSFTSLWAFSLHISGFLGFLVPQIMVLVIIFLV